MLPYYNRILRTYLSPRGSNLSFWHETPELNPDAFEPDSVTYYMTFAGKAEYAGPFDDNGVPMLDYRGDIGRQYNPIAIAQYGLALINKAERQTEDCNRGYKVTELQSYKGKSENNVSRSTFHVPQSAIACADWLVDNLEENAHGIKVWMHHFDWPYFKLLKAPWYSGLAQGQGISLLLRVWRLTDDQRYLKAAVAAFESLQVPVAKGGVQFVDADGHVWLEEYITDPPTHILNGFIWGLWGVWDAGYGIRDAGCGIADEASRLWERCVETLEHNLAQFDSGFWSLYDLAPVSMRNPASAFYHRLHIVQLRVMHRLTGKDIFDKIANRWESYAVNGLSRRRAFLHKCLFKLRYY